MADTQLQRARVLQRRNKLVSFIFIGAFAIPFFSAQYLLAMSSIQPWWLPDVLDLIALFFMAIPYVGGIYYRNKIGEVSFEYHPTDRSLRFEDEQLQGEWLILREGKSDSERVMTPLSLIIGGLIVVMAIATWIKSMHFHGGFQRFQEAGAIQFFLIGCTILLTGVQSWTNRVYKYRVYVQKRKILLTLGIRVPLNRQ